MSESYPKRPQLFALHYCKALTESEAIKICGRDAVLFAVFIVNTEDKLHYNTAPRFWREELMRRLGFRSPKDILRIKNRAIDSGLVRQVEGNRTTMPQYWVLEPEWLKPFIRSQTGTQKTFDVPKREHENKTTRSQKGTQSGTQSGTLSKPNTHNPLSKSKKEKFVPPTLEEVQAHCIAKGIKIDAEHFHAHHDQAGWILSGGKKMKRWKSAIVIWQKNGERFGNSTPQATGRPKR